MEDLLPYYERELAYLRRYSEDFAQRYPKIAGRLLSVGAHIDDPYIEQLIQAMALLDARIGKKLDDDYPQCVEALFDVLHPHYLRPFPACSIAHFKVAAADRGARPYVLERGRELVGWSINGIQCRFKTAYDVTLAPSTSYGLSGVLRGYVAVAAFFSLPLFWSALVLSILVGIAIAFLKASALKEWVSHSKFSKGEHFDSLEAELKAFSSAAGG